jgi:hypothetical protein
VSELIDLRPFSDRRVRCSCGHEFSLGFDLREGHGTRVCKECRQYVVVFAFAPLACRAAITCSFAELKDMSAVIARALDAMTQRSLAHWSRVA